MGLVAIIRSSMVVVLFLLLLLVEWGSQCHGCWAHERTALLQIKSSFNRPAPYNDYRVSSWGIDADCCTWAGVTCNATTKRVTELDLWPAADTGSKGWYLNASLFLPFKDLTSLDLGRNKILGCIENEGFEKLSKLAHLESLILYSNEFNESIFSSLRSLLSLKSLDLSNNNLKGIVNIQELHPLSQLEELDLSENEITRFVGEGDNKSINNCSVLNLGGIKTDASSVLELQSLHRFFPNLKSLYLTSYNLQRTSFGSYHLSNLEGLYLDDCIVDDNFLQSIGALVSLRNLSMGRMNGSQLTQVRPYWRSLEHLFIYDCQLSGHIPKSLCKLNQLITLDISGNNLSGALPPCMANLTSLQQLDLSFNNLSGTLPPCMTNLTSLRQLYLSYNQFTGNISQSPLRTLTSIEYLYLSHNQFQIPVTLGPFFNHTKLDSLSARGNNIFAETEQHSSIPKFQLTGLYLSGYGYGGMFPKFLYYQHNLQYVDLSHIQLSGGFPYWLLENNTDLSRLYLLNTSLSRQLRLPSHSHTSLEYLDISKNCLRGHVPALIGAHLPNLQYLNLSGNSFNGRIPPSLGNMSTMAYLDLSNNGLSGEVPVQLATGCLLLRELVLSNNSLQGQILPRNVNLRYLRLLDLNGNQFTGTIVNSLSNSSSLIILDLSRNHIHGRLPQWIGNMSALRVLDLSHNDISGSLPSNFSSTIEQVYLSNNRLQGLLENAFYNSFNLVMLDLGRNNFTGSIPEWIATFSNLSYLHLDNNYLEGEIPIQLCKLDKLRLIDFSHNHLTGHILPCLRSGNTWDVTLYFINFTSVGDSIYQPHAEFTTKSFSYSYQGRPLSYMSGIDLSCNNLTGEIPPQLGNLSTIKMLNLSHNRLIGPIPSTFSNLKEIESLDLSCNNLAGKIPPQLTQLHQLEVFTVAHNNLSGKIPDMVEQFATFENRSYDDNPLLCGPPLTRSCNARPSPPSSSKNSGKQEEETGLISMDAFYPSFLASYSVVLLGMVAVLYINPHWRRAWFSFVDECINSCYYFIVDNLPILSKYRDWQPCV